MALKHLDLEEQEQIDRLKGLWARFGNLISGALIAVCAAVLAYNGYQWWQTRQAARAASMYDEMERLVKDGDPVKIVRAFTDMKDKVGSSAATDQAAFIAAKTLYAKGQPEQAALPLDWVAGNSKDEGHRAIAKLRLASLLSDSKSFDAALKLTEGLPKEFEGLAADRRGDIFLAQGKRDEARSAYQIAYKALGEQDEYRSFIEVKLNALGVDVSAKAEPASSAQR